MQPLMGGKPASFELFSAADNSSADDTSQRGVRTRTLFC